MQKIKPIGQIATSLIIVATYLIIFIFFAFAYRLYLFSVFEYAGFKYNLKLFNVSTSILVIIATSTILSFFTKKLSHLLLHILFLLPVIPMVVIYGIGEGSQSYFFATMLSFLLVIIIVTFPIHTPRIKNLPFSSVLHIDIAMRVLLIFGIFYIGTVIFYGGLSYLNFDIWKVYEFRREAANNLPGIFGYLMPIASNFVVPTLLALALMQRRWFFGLFAIFLSIFIFTTAAHKAPLFNSFVVIGIYILFSLKHRLYLLLAAQIIVVLGTIYSPFIGDTDQIFGSLVLRRTYFVPAQINYEYYNFFFQNEKVLWSNSKITLGLLEYPYKLSVPQLIGQEQFNTSVYANTGWLGSGYAQLGFFGVFIYAFIIGLLIKITNLLSNKTNLSFAGALFVVPYLSLFTSADIPTMLLTHGLIFVLLFAFLIKGNNTSYEKNRPS